MEEETRVENLSYSLSIIPDPRVDRRKEHKRHDVLMIAVLARLCGAESFVDFEDCGKAKEDWLGGFLDLPKGIPSHDTFGRVFAAMDNKLFAGSFRNGTDGLRQKISGGIVAIDGQTLRRSYEKRKSTRAIHRVSAWGRDNGLVLGQIKVDEKSYEITAIPQLLRTLDLADCIVAIDAPGAQKEIAREIRNADADYVLALKGNPETALEEVSRFLLDAKDHRFAGTAHDFLKTVEKDHGRIETRRYWITEKIGWFADRALWDGLRSFGMVESLREIEGVSTREVRFFLASIPADARTFSRAVRGHRAIENSLHWSLDVCFAEDASPPRLCCGKYGHPSSYCPPCAQK